MASGSYAALESEGGNVGSPREQERALLSPPALTSPRLGETDLGRMSIFSQHTLQHESFPSHSRSGTALSNYDAPRAESPGYPQIFSSAQAYAPVSNDAFGRPPTPGTPGSPGLYGDMYRSPSSRPFVGSTSTSDRASHRLSVASSHMLQTSDFGSQHQLMRYSDSAAIPLHEYEKDYNAGSRATTPGVYMPVEDISSRARPTKEKYTRSGRTPMAARKKWCIFAAVVAGLILVAIAVAVPLLVVKDRNSSSNSATVDGTGPHGEVLTSGTNGSSIRMDNGTTFTYINNFGGEWRSGLTDDGARAQNYTPALNETWDYAQNAMLGVNLGGWLVLESFIVPSLFEPYENGSKYVVDEYTLMQEWQKEGGQALKEKNLRQHYDTFITEYDFMMIAAAGLNWIRLPIAYWAVATLPDDPFVEGMSWEYLLKAIQWARKYGLRINLDLHAVPGSQNGYNHGGRLGVFNFLNSPSGMVSAERALDTIRVIAEFIAQPEIANVVPVFGILNEPNLPIGIGQDNLRRFYIEAYAIIRNVTGLGQGKGPYVSFHDGFVGLGQWTGFMQGADRVAWDLHPYNCFVPPFGDRQALVAAACNGFAANTDTGLTQFGVTMAGEWSLASNDCGLFLNGPFQGVRYDGSWAGGSAKQGECGPFDDWQSYNASTKGVMYQAAVTQMASFRNFFFWTWKIGNSLRTGQPVNPNWSYSLGYEQGWMPKNPRAEMQNACGAAKNAGVSAITKTALTWSTSFAAYETGAAATYTPNTASYSWPPPALSVSAATGGSSYAVSALPTYTPTGAVIVPPTPTYSATFANEAQPSIDPWVQGGRQTPGFVAVQGCNYFDSIWSNVTAPPSGWPCSGSGSRRRWTADLMQFDDIFARHDQELTPAVVRRAAWQKPQMTAAPQR